MTDNFERRYRAISSRDRRFDGRFVTAVTSTGIYCRPSCPAQTPRRENIRFYEVAAAAQAAGFRACKRCRPQAAPGSPDWDVRADLTARALRLIAEGVVDTDGVAGLARRLAVSERHLNRQLVAEVGVGPLALARTRRAQTARLLVESTAMPLGDVAFTAGYASIRQFNASIQEAFGAAPSTLRQQVRAADRPATGAITLRLSFRPPYDAAALLDWLAARAIPGVDEVAAGTYRRTVRLPRTHAVIELTPTVRSDGGAKRAGATEHVQLRVIADQLADLSALVARVRALADLDADMEPVTDVLRRDPLLQPLVEARPGLRVPGTTDGFELAVRAVLGQQVTVTGARTLAGRLVAALGKPLDSAVGGVTHLFPSPEAVADSDLDGLGLTGARRQTLRALASAVHSGDVRLDRGADRTATILALQALPGIGAWTSSYIAMRALGDPDAFPAADLGLVRASAALGGPKDARDLAVRAERWQPWRAYAAQHLWSAL